METWCDSQVLFNGKVVRLRVGSVLLDDGTRAYREVIEHPGGACVLPFTGDTFIFVRQYRIALNQYLLEAPAGKLESGETPEICAHKELHEETGYAAGHLIPLGVMFSAVGFCSEAIHLFLATELTAIGSMPEVEERLEIVTMTVAEAKQALYTNVFEDAKTHIVVHRALLLLESQGLL